MFRLSRKIMKQYDLLHLYDSILSLISCNDVTNKQQNGCYMLRTAMIIGISKPENTRCTKLLNVKINTVINHIKLFILNKCVKNKNGGYR